jgi:hypothetical protein
MRQMSMMPDGKPSAPQPDGVSTHIRLDPFIVAETCAEMPACGTSITFSGAGRTTTGQLLRRSPQNCKGKAHFTTPYARL